jgi:hypothetical protein
MVRSFFKNIYYDIKYIFNGIISIIKWIPIIYEDRWWDHYFFFRILEFKLKIVEDSFLKLSHHLGSEKEAKKMKICRILCKRINDDNYYENISEDHDKKWGKLDLKFEDTNNEMFKEIIFERENLKTQEDYDKEHKEQQRLWKKEEYLRNQDLELLFKTLRKNVLKWCD